MPDPRHRGPLANRDGSPVNRDPREDERSYH